ncbi:MAG: hypothetical protein JWM11_7921 [Planctomycetaceae bacterium]|nr:hypothetical protein [Planctomycetaceae bacterium]
METQNIHTECGPSTASRLLASVLRTLSSLLVACVATVFATSAALLIVVARMPDGGLSRANLEFALFFAFGWGLLGSVPVGLVTLFCDHKSRLFVSIIGAIFVSLLAGMGFSLLIRANADV